MALETKEKTEKAMDALREFQKAKANVAKAQEVANQKFTALKNFTGFAGQDQVKAEEEILREIGAMYVAGKLEE